MAMNAKTTLNLFVSDDPAADKKVFMEAGYAALKALYPSLPDLPDFGAGEGDEFSVGGIDPSNGSYGVGIRLPGNDTFALQLTDKE